MRINRNGLFLTAIMAALALMLAGCGGVSSNSGGSSVSNETAATVNGKAISMEEVERAIKQQAQGQETRMSQLELTGARLQVLDGLIQREVMFQKAEKEGVVPTDEEVSIEVNKSKVDSRLSSEDFDKQMKLAGFDEKGFREKFKRDLAVQKLVEKVTGKIETPKDSEIEEFFKSNPEMFIKKRGVRLAAIVVDPTDGGQGDTTRNAAEAQQKLQEVLGKVSQPASDFAALAREYSEDSSRLQGGDLGYISEDDLKRNFGEQIATGFMNPTFSVGKIGGPINLQGKYYIFKLQEKIEKDENLTLESPEVRPQINQLLVDNRKQLLAASYQAIAMNEAKIENLLAKKVVDNPNELSGARPAAPANSNTAASNTNTSSANSTSANIAPANTNTNTGKKPVETNTAPAKPAATAPAKPAANAPAKPANK